MLSGELTMVSPHGLPTSVTLKPTTVPQAVSTRYTHYCKALVLIYLESYACNKIGSLVTEWLII